MKTHAAQIVFIEDDRYVRDANGDYRPANRWTGHLFPPRSEVMERVRRWGEDLGLHPLDHTPTCIIEEGEDGWAQLTTQGGDKNGRRYRHYPSVTEAQEAAIKWASRKYRVAA